MRKTVVITAFAAMALFLLCVCGPAAAQSGRMPKIDKFAVMPFIIAQPDTADAPAATCAITGGCFSSSAVPPEAVNIMNNLLDDRLHKVTDIPFVPADQTGLVARSMIGRDIWLAQREDVAKLGRKLKVDAVLIGAIYRWRERVGSAAAAETPAAVTFELALVLSQDGSLLWTASWDEVQKPLTDNWLNIGDYLRHGIKWFTVKQFAAIGLDTVMQRFPFRDKAPAE